MRKMVVGLIFDCELKNILLIKKNRPEWQAGRFNGIGGKVEKGETYTQALSREVQEEAGLSICKDMWSPVLEYTGDDYQVDFYFIILGNRINTFKQMTDEEVLKMSLAEIAEMDEDKIIYNLKWIIPLALDTYIKKPIRVAE